MWWDRFIPVEVNTKKLTTKKSEKKKGCCWFIPIIIKLSIRVSKCKRVKSIRGSIPLNIFCSSPKYSHIERWHPKYVLSFIDSDRNTFEIFSWYYLIWLYTHLRHYLLRYIFFCKEMKRSQSTRRLRDSNLSCFSFRYYYESSIFGNLSDTTIFPKHGFFAPEVNLISFFNVS